MFAALHQEVDGGEADIEVEIQGQHTVDHPLLDQVRNRRVEPFRVVDRRPIAAFG